MTEDFDIKDLEKDPALLRELKEIWDGDPGDLGDLSSNKDLESSKEVDLNDDEAILRSLEAEVAKMDLGDSKNNNEVNINLHLEEYQKKLRQTKKTALEYRQAGKKQQALHEMRIIKALQSVIDTVDNGDEKVYTKEYHTQVKNQIEVLEKARSTIDTSSVSSENEQINQVIRFRSEQYKKVALDAKRSGKIDDAKNNMSTALKVDHLLKRMKSGEKINLSDLPPPPQTESSKKQEISIKKTPQKTATKIKKPPIAKKIPLATNLKAPVIHKDIAADELELHLIKVTLNSPMTIYLTWELFDEQYQTNAYSSDGKVAKIGNKKKLKLKRTRLVANKINRTKFEFELYRRRRLMGDELIGRSTSVRLASLLEKAEMIGKTQVSDDKNQWVGEIEYAFRTRQVYGVSDSSIPEENVPQKTRVISPKTKHQKVTIPNNISKKVWESPNDIFLINTNDVLDWEINTMEERIKTLKKGKKEIPTELSDRHSAAIIQRQIIVTQVQNNKLVIKDYLQRLRDNISHDIILAKGLHAADRKEEAKHVLNRIKIMKSELNTAEKQGL